MYRGTDSLIVLIVFFIGFAPNPVFATQCDKKCQRACRKTSIDTMDPIQGRFLDDGSDKERIQRYNKLVTYLLRVATIQKKASLVALPQSLPSKFYDKETTDMCYSIDTKIARTFIGLRDGKILMIMFNVYRYLICTRHNNSEAYELTLRREGDSHLLGRGSGFTGDAFGGRACMAVKVPKWCKNYDACKENFHNLFNFDSDLRLDSLKKNYDDDEKVVPSENMNVRIRKKTQSQTDLLSKVTRDLSE